MNKKIKIIDLLNKIANGEIKDETKFRIHFKGGVTRDIYYIAGQSYYDCLRNVSDNCAIYDEVSFNEVVEILEDNTEEIEELDEEWTYIEGQVEKTWSKSELELVNKINELVKVVNSIRKDKNND